LWPALLHLIEAVDERERMQVGIDFLEDLLLERPLQYAEQLIESARADSRVAGAVCVSYLPEGYEERIYEAVGRRPGGGGGGPHSG
jgi:hypothetical protein